MTVARHSLLRRVLPCVGLALTCIGVVLMSLQAEHMLEAPTWMLVSAYVAILLGLLSMVCGVIWTTYHSMKTSLYRRGSNRETRRVQIYTIERPTSFPPLYEEFQQSQACADRGAGSEVAGETTAPPLYSRDSSEAPDCTWSWERPPRYSRIDGIQQGQVDAGEQTRKQ